MLGFSSDEKIAAAQTLIAEEVQKHPRHLLVTNSFQAEDMVVQHMVRQHLPEPPAVFLDTGYHFAEVYEYRDRMTRAWQMNLINVPPEMTVVEQESQFGILNQSDPGRCCGIRKVNPRRVRAAFQAATVIAAMRCC